VLLALPNIRNHVGNRGLDRNVQRYDTRAHEIIAKRYHTILSTFNHSHHSSPPSPHAQFTTNSLTPPENAAYLAYGDYPSTLIKIITFDSDTHCIAGLVIPVTNNKADGRRMLCKGHSSAFSPRKHIEALEDLLTEIKAVVRNNAKWEFGDDIEVADNGILGNVGTSGVAQ